MSRIVWGKRFSFLIRSRPLDIIFFEVLVFGKTHSLFKLTFKATHLQKIREYDISQKPLFCTSTSSMNLGLNPVPVAAGQYLWRYFIFLDSKLIIFGVSMHFWTNKNQKIVRQIIFRQSWTRHLWAFSLFSTISLHRKWSGNRLLSPDSEFSLFCESVYNLFSKIVWGNRFSFLTQSRFLWLSIFWRFSLWKDSFVLQIDN